ncbi:hypothetical protein [Pelosinus propionicus]|uniref:Uncharacterized protein n=1 Tax=Pelosinus propionicus DSM 13327 TaxID=1123291 RepID=A0A1I4MFU9_9FIRM|nr:hypothetical protein [Pelosinus propionicus]SFM02154.1 hypothetical protein SAMN04490355_103337 [Pelosinus propionicus DSM 13327]
MSAFLGHIHYWLYHKIGRVVEREQLIFQKAEEMCGAAAEELQSQVWQIYGQPLPDTELGELIDHSNIHGWLQRQITIAETREAAFIKELLDTCGGAAQDIVLSAYAEHGKLCGEHAKSQEKYDGQRAAGIYQAVNDYILNGMPCDQGDVVTVNEADTVIWEGETCLQERNWTKAGVDKAFMKECYQKWFVGFVKALNPAFTYNQTADTLKGGPVNRHQILKEA